MARLRAVIQFEIAGLLVRRAALGWRQRITRDRYSVEVRLPTADDEYPLGPETYATREDVWGPFADLVTDVSNPDVQIRRIRIDVSFDSDLSIDPWNDEDGSKPVNEAIAEMQAAEHVARDVAAELLGWARVARPQPWLGPSGYQPESTGLQSLLDDDAGQRFPVGHSGMTITMPSEDAPLEVSELSDILGQVEEAALPPDPEVFLRDAQYFAWHAETKHPTRAVLLAAIACELKIKTTMREKVETSRLPLVDAVVRSQRPIVGLLDGPLLGALGVSLKADDKDLYEKIDRLFQLRNGVAHRGEPVASDDANGAIAAAQVLFRWLDGLPPDPR
jgi:hypothetical protein